MDIFFEALVKLLVLGGITVAIICPDKLKAMGSTIKSENNISKGNKLINEKRSEMIDIISWSLTANSGEEHNKIEKLSFTSYSDIVKQLDFRINAIRQEFSSIERENARIAKTNSNKDQIIEIENRKYEILHDINSRREKYVAYINRIQAFPRESKLVNDKSYGTINQSFLDEIRKLDKNSVERYVEFCHKVLSEKNTGGIYQIDLSVLVKCLWVFAIDDNFNYQTFEYTKKAFKMLYKGNPPDVVLAEF